MALRATAAAAVLAALAGGCALSWDGRRPAPLADAGDDLAAAELGPAPDIAPDQQQDSYAGDLPTPSPDGPPADAPPPDGPLPDAALVDGPRPDIIGCPYMYTGFAKPADSVKEVNARVKLGWTPAGFPHATADHAAWLVNGSAYELEQAADGAALEKAVEAKLSKPGASYKVLAFLANKGTAVWMSNGSKFKFAKDVAAVNALSGLSYTVHAYLRHEGPQLHAAWLKQGATYKLMTGNFTANLSQDVRKQMVLGWQPTKALTNDAKHAFWVTDNALHFDMIVSSVAGQVNTWLSGVKSNQSVDVVHAVTPHAAWLIQGVHNIIAAADGRTLAGKLNYELQATKTTKVGRLFANQDNVVWLHKASCP